MLIKMVRQEMEKSLENNWIFLRGLTRGNIHWGVFPELFLKANSNAQVEYREIPGNGSLTDMKTPTSPEAVVNFLRQSCKLVNGVNRYHLCGVSLGGMIALQWAQMYPAEVLSVNIINSSLGEHSPFYERLIPQNYLKLLSAIFKSNTYDQEKIILEITSNRYSENEKYLSSFAEFASKHKVSYANFIRQLLLAGNIKINPTIKSVNVFSAARDRLVSPICSEKIAKEFKAKLIQHPSAGHDLPLDEPDWLIEKLLEITGPQK